jgi:hypothetical protein
VNAFESFDVTAWSVDGMTQHIKNIWSAGKPRRLRIASTVRLALASAASTAVITIATPWASMQGQSPTAETAVDVRSHQATDVILGSPVEYWARIASEMHSWKPVDTPLPEIPTFI